MRQLYAGPSYQDTETVQTVFCGGIDMRKISVDGVREGMLLARTIYSEDGNILLSAGMKLMESYISRLKGLNIYEIYIDDKISYDIEINDVISDETRFEARVAIKNAMDSIRFGSSIDVKPIRDTVCRMIDELMDARDAVINLHDIKSLDQYTFGHSVNVCVLSIITGLSMDYDQDKLKELAMGAMLHDIGKTRIPAEILNKPDALTDSEFEIIKKHTNYGYEMLKKSVELTTYASYIALTHHEKYNGEGYPLGLKGDGIHEFSRIVAIADVYDAITSDRAYKRRRQINEAIEYLVGMGGHHFDYQIVRKFLEHITTYPLGTCVKLNTGQTAIVVDINKKYPNRPIIRLIRDEAGVMLDRFSELDLTTNNTLLITDIVEEI